MLPGSRALAQAACSAVAQLSAPSCPSWGGLTDREAFCLLQYLLFILNYSGSYQLSESGNLPTASTVKTGTKATKDY